MVSCCFRTQTTSDASITPSASGVVHDPTRTQNKGVSYDVKLGRVLAIIGLVLIIFAGLCAGGLFGRGTPYLIGASLALGSIPFFSVASVKLCKPAHWVLPPRADVAEGASPSSAAKS